MKITSLFQGNREPPLHLSAFDGHPYLLHDPLLVVVAQRAAQLVVVHRRSVLLDPPPAGHLETGPNTLRGRQKEALSRSRPSRPGFSGSAVHSDEETADVPAPVHQTSHQDLHPRPAHLQPSPHNELSGGFILNTGPGPPPPPPPPPSPGSPPSSCLPVLGEAP